MSLCSSLFMGNSYKCSTNIKKREGYKAISSLVKHERKENQKGNESEVQREECAGSRRHLAQLCC